MMGVDGLPSNLGALTARAGNIWSCERQYELSYNQFCIAFFEAASQLGILELNFSGKQ